MKTVMLCGGKGNRLSELTEDIPKPLIEIGATPVMLHIMKRYAHYGFTDFVLCLGHKGTKIRDYFRANPTQGWRVDMVDTGEDTSKADRLRLVKDLVRDEADFFLAYGDDVCNVDITRLLGFHRECNKTITLTAVRPENPYGVLDLDGDVITGFTEKPKMVNWINGGYFVVSSRIFECIRPGDDLEKDVFERLAEQREMAAFRHDGFWKSMNTFKDMQELNTLWNRGEAEWRI